MFSKLLNRVKDDLKNGLHSTYNKKLLQILLYRVFQSILNYFLNNLLTMTALLFACSKSSISVLETIFSIGVWLLSSFFFNSLYLSAGSRTLWCNFFFGGLGEASSLLEFYAKEQFKLVTHLSTYLIS